MSTDNLVSRRDLGSAGIAWVRRSLEEGMELSATVLDSTDLDAGVALGFYPPDLEPQAALRFEGTLFSPRGALDVKIGALAELSVLQAARDIVDGVVVLESARTPAQADDSTADWRSEVLPPARRIRGKHVLYWRRVRDGDLDDLATFLSAEGGYDNAFVFAQSPDSQHPDVLRRIATSALGILVPAYDSESYVLWTPRGVIAKS